ncbi:MAG: zinc ABC transporter substrate-binding protein, partial [Clostridiales bacterium]|nr:zinc ABC transporter substrate-binding protein [Clostridiales bacterium]
MKRKIIALLLCFLLFATQGTIIGYSQEQQTKTIITSFYPIYAMVVNITKDIKTIQVKNMADVQTGCLHEYQLLPQDMKNLAQGEVFCINGAGMESFLETVIAQFP